jgi:uncharacterized membrane protein
MRNRSSKKRTSYNVSSMNICTRTFVSSIWLALVLFFCGNIIYQGTLDGRKIFLEASDWGLALIPAFLVLLFCSRKIWKNTTPIRSIRILWQKLLKKRQSSRIVLSLFIVPLLLLVWRSVIHRYLSFESGWDLGIYGQACANGLYSSLREERTLLADHFEPILALFVPICGYFDAPFVLLTAQILALGIGVAGIIKLAQAMLWSLPSTLCVALLFIVFTGNKTTFFYDFHPVTFSAATIPWLVLSLRSGAYLRSFILILITMALKETSALTIAGIGLWWALDNISFRQITIEKKKVITGLSIATIGFVSFFLVMKVAFPYFRGGAESLYFTKYYGHLGQNMSDVVSSIIFNPTLVAETVFTKDKLIYLLKVFTPFLFAAFFRPHFLIPVIPALMVNLLTSHPYLFSARFHYEAEIYPWLFVASILLSRDPIFLQRWYWLRRNLPLTHLPTRLSFRVAWLLVMLCFFGGKSLAWYSGSYPVSHQQLVIRNYLIAEKAQWVNARVAAFEPLVQHLTSVRHLFLLDRWRDADWVIVGYPAGKRSWVHSIEEIETSLIPEMSGDFELFYQDPVYPTFRIWKRKS